MALQITISGDTSIVHGQQTTLTASVIDTDTNAAPTGTITYAWRVPSGQGSFVGSTNAASVIYLADIPGNAATTVSVTCAVTVAGTGPPSVSAPSLTAMTTLGITDQRVNMLIMTEIDGNDLYDREDFANTIAAGSDTSLIGFDGIFQGTLNVYRIRWLSSSRIFRFNRYADDTTNMSTFWTAGHDTHSVFLILADGSVIEIDGDWYVSSGGGFVSWRIPESETAVLALLNGIGSGELLLVGVGTSDSISDTGSQTESATAMVSVAANQPPVVSITAPSRLDPGEGANISATVTDPEGGTTTLVWSVTGGGSIGNTTALNTTITAPLTPGTIVLTATATDTDGQVGSNSQSIIVNSPPTLSINVTDTLEVNDDGTLTATVGDPDNDPVTVLWSTTGGTIANPTALSTAITAPSGTGTVIVTCVATDSEGAETTETATISVIANQAPTITISVPSVLGLNESGAISANVSDPTDDDVTVLWSATGGGVIADTDALSTTITAPGTGGTITVTCVATDEHGATATATATITVRQPNRPPTVTLNVPTSANLGQTVNVVATVTDPDGDPTTGQWNAPAGSFANAGNKSTTFTAPLETGVVPITFEAMDDMGATASKTAYITVGDPKANIYTPAYQIEIEGVDVTKRWIKRDGMIIGKQLDYPNTSRFRSSEIRFNVDNEDGIFDYSHPNNFFVANGLPAHGRGAKVLIRLGLSASELAPVFGGIISELVTSLGDTKAQITLHDLSQKLSRSDVKNFGEEIKRRITDFDGVNGDYDDLDPVFYFPWWGLPIARNSVSLVVHIEDGTDINIDIVDTIATSGMLSNTRAEVDYNRGLIRFEAPPTDGADTEITATWKVDYKYKRPDFLIRQLSKHAGIQSELGITDEKAARFGIEQALVSHPSSESFSSHGRPYAQESGVVRWMRRNGDIWQMIQDQRYLEYDEHQDEYKQITTLPEESGLEGTVNVDYGKYLPDESFLVPYRGDIRPGSYALSTLLGVGATDDRIYFLSSNSSRQGTLDLRNKVYLSATLRDGTPLLSERRELDLTQEEVGSRAGLSIYDRHAYIGYIRSGEFRMRVYNLASGNRATDREFSVSYSGSWTVTSIDVKANGIYAILTKSNPNGTFLRFFSLDGVEDTDQSYRTTSSGAREDETQVARNDNHLFVIRAEDIRAFTPAGVRDTDSDIPYTTEYTSQSSETTYAVEATNTRLYIFSEGIVSGSYQGNLWAYDLGISVDFGGFVPYQFDSADNNKLFFICANNTQGNAVSQSTLRKVKVYKYVKSTRMWTDLLNETTGQPQLSHAYKIAGEVTYLADNRKNFEAIRHNNETLVFYRRVRATASGVAYYNDNDSTVTDVYSENHSGSEDYGLPYSMDFALDVRSDGIYVYTFVVRHELDSNDNYDGGTLKVYRKRVEPNGTQTEIYSETFTKSVDAEDYPVSVSDLILADNRLKFYFTLEYHGENERPGKSELCTIAKSGSGSRTVIKTYENPLVGARSPVKRGSSYFYLEGGWVRQSKDDPLDETIPDDQHHYPNQGGTLIEIASDDSITDHGQVWRSATKQDSPDPENEDGVYNGWGLHNAVLSNMIVDGRGNLHFVAGYGSPYNISENLPFSSNREPVPALSNYHWLQWGKDLSTKIASFPTTDVKAWGLIEQLAQLMGWEIGFGPGVRKVDAIQAADSAITDWGANASFFFRPRTILPSHLRTALSGSGNPSSIALNDMGLPAEASEFPVPPAGERYAVIIDKEMFTYTGVTPDSQGRTLTGVQRAQNGSVAAAHSVDAAVYFVDYFASGELGTTLVLIQNKSVDFVNLRNDVNVNYGGAVYPTKNQRSVDENGEFTFDLQNSLLSKYDQAWAELIGDTYLDELSDLKELLTATLVFSPRLQPGQLVVVYQLDRVRIEFKLFRLLQAQHHTHPRWQTGVTALEIIPEGVPPRWLTVPRQLLRFNQSLNLDLKGYLAGTRPIRIEATGLPSGFTISNGVISGSSNTAGEHTITLTATNNDGEATASFDLLIGQPRWPSIPVQSITESDFLIFDFTSYAPEGLAPITYAIGGSAPSWVSRSGDFILGQPPNTGSDQTYIIPLIATNPVGASTVNIVLTVEDTI